MRDPSTHRSALLPMVLCAAIAAWAGCGTTDAETEGPADTGSLEDDTSPGEDAVSENDTGAEDDTGAEGDADIEDPAAVALREFMALCEEYAAIECGQVYDSACDGDEVAIDARSLRELAWNFEDSDACADAMARLHCQRYSPSIESGWIEVQPAETQACFEELSGYSCEEYVRRNSDPELSSCSFATVGNVADGETCQINQDCVDGLFCDGGIYRSGAEPGEWYHEQGTCAPRLAEGEPCRGTSDCSEGLTCERVGDERLCSAEA